MSSMSKFFVLILWILPCYLVSQEQVSDIKYSGTFERTNIEGKIGFTEIDGVQYLLQENDSILIYKWDSQKFVPYSSIKVGQEKNQRILINPNRSLFEFRNNRYYRFYENGLQVIDIVNSRIVADYPDITSQTFLPTEITNERLYFTTSQFGSLPNSYLELSTNSIHNLQLPETRTNYSQLGHLISGLKNGKDIYIYNALTNKDTWIYTLTDGIFNATVSRADTTFVFIAKNGTILKIDRNLKLTVTKCKIENLSKTLRISVHGDKLIVVYDDGIDNNQDLVIVKNVLDNKVEMSFLTKVRQPYIKELHFIPNEYHDKNFFILGYSGQPDIPDSPIQGLYYILDFNNKKEILIENVTSIKNHTPIKINDAICFVALHHNGMGYFEDFVKINLSNLEKFEFNPNAFRPETVVLGYPFDNDLIFSFNSIFKNDSTQVIRLQENNNYILVNDISFLYNVGVASINNIIKTNNNLIFSNEVGIYNLDNDANMVLETDKISYFSTGFIFKREIAYFENKICLFIKDKVNPMYIIIDLATHKIDTVKVFQGSFSQSAVLALGPLLLYNPYTAGAQLHIYDLQTNTLQVSHEYANLTWRTLDVKTSEKFAITLQNTTVNKKVPYKLNLETKEIKKLDFEFHKNVQVYFGGENSFYFINYFNNSDSFDIHLLNQKDEFRLLYRGLRKKFWTVNFSKSPNQNISFMSVAINNAESILITDNLEQTSIQVIKNINLAQNIKTFNDVGLLSTSYEFNNKYWLCNGMKPLVDISSIQNSKLLFSDVNDSLATVVLKSGTKTFFVSYDYKYSFESITEVDNEFEDFCNLAPYHTYFPLNNKEYLIRTSCNQGAEPYILDIANMKMKLLSDINTGTASSSPSDFVKFGDWVYFTATIPDKSRQWFRVSTGSTSHTIEQVSNQFVSLNIYPSPAHDVIHLNHTLEEVSITDINGQVVYKSSVYLSHQPIDISRFYSGYYFVFGKSTDGLLRTGSFVKVQ